MDGNACYIDTLGFIKPRQKVLEGYQINRRHSNRSFFNITNVVNNLSPTKKSAQSQRKLIKDYNADNCWICNNWQEVKFTYEHLCENEIKEEESSKQSEESKKYTSIGIHFPFEGFEKNEMELVFQN